jgi:hypothetical protein
MRCTLLILLPLALLGCESSRSARLDRSPPASALAMTPDIANFAPPMDLDRDSRQASAYVGYDSAQVTTYYVHIDDRYRSSDNTRWNTPSFYERRAVSTTVSTRVR